MRLTPGSVFLSLVALGLPFAVTVGWTLGTPAAPPPAVASAPGGAGGIGAAPVDKQPVRTTTKPVEWSPRAPRPVSVVESVAPTSPATAAERPASVAPSTAASPSPSTALTAPPVPTPTAVVTDPPTPTPTAEPSDSGPEEPPSGFGGFRLGGRRH